VRHIQDVYDEELARAGVLLDVEAAPVARPAGRGSLELPPA